MVAGPYGAATASVAGGPPQVNGIALDARRTSTVAPRRRAKKQVWFDRGIEALQRARPGAPRVYGCPLCLRGFASPHALSFEDVPPKSIGGKPLVLTCRDCNSASGHSLDAFIRADRDAQDVLTGKKETIVRLSRDGHTITAAATLGPDGFRFAGLPDQSNPIDHAKFFEFMEAAARSGSSDWGFTMTLTFRRSPERAAIGWLRVGYLHTFAALGYHYVMRPALDQIRRQIKSPAESIAPGLVKLIPKPLGPDGLAIVDSPRELSSILVHLGPVLVFLPNFDHSADFYQRIRALPAAPLTLAGKHVDLPRQPVFAIDMSLPQAPGGPLDDGGV